MSSGFDRAGANARQFVSVPRPASAITTDVIGSPVFIGSGVANTVRYEDLLPPTAVPSPRAMGFTGNTCTNCQGTRMQIAGHCEVCTDCGTSSGCS